MLRFMGKGQTHTCGGITRRDFLHAGSLSAIGLSLPQYLGARELGRIKRGHDERACIMIFNLGAPSHLDTWDMKPEAPSEIRGPFKPIRTRSPDIQLSELLPLHAKIADKFSLVRSCYHTGAAVHDVGWQTMQTGRMFTNGVQTPHAGAAIGYLRGGKNHLPAHVVLPETMGRGGGNLPSGQAGGFLGSAHDPCVLMANPAQPTGTSFDQSSPYQIGLVHTEQRRSLRDTVDRALQRFEADAEARLRDGHLHSAYSLMTSKQARSAFDLNQEPLRVHERYGLNRFGQCCLLARRLVEAGVRFVTINTFVTVFNEITWDIHGTKPFTTITEMQNVVAPMYDQAYSALIEDLCSRGMLDNTLVCNLAEFGRTPRINPSGGRDHWPGCYTVYFAGGGVQGGRVVGRSDAIGGEPAERPTTPAEIVATIFHSLGFDLATVLPGPANRPLPLVDTGIEEIKELFS